MSLYQLSNIYLKSYQKCIYTIILFDVHSVLLFIIILLNIFYFYIHWLYFYSSTTVCYSYVWIGMLIFYAIILFLINWLWNFYIIPSSNISNMLIIGRKFLKPIRYIGFTFNKIFYLIKLKIMICNCKENFALKLPE